MNMTPSEHKRRFRNKVNNPYLQIKIGLYCIVLSLLFGISVLGILYYKFNELFDLILDLTDAQDTVKEIISTYWFDAQFWLLLALLIYIALTIVISIFYTHHLIGPTIAFRRHIDALAQLNFRVRTQVRKGDAFNEIALALNNLSEKLERHLKKEKTRRKK